ncbi:MAG: hypothetical protein ACTSXO_10215 [Candidatus Heimdallarchaeota archaeon]|nr:hypothetical protein [Candidatus Heimdallarchaeota archaeon]RLI66783.1 MAG: hypothetical protein DRO63_05750 [Candidatus Gerdarchaeota archaeon]RLI68937.1 MAG: hypothetical protein DRO91_08340 [Candidatus Heimdallarchaeota archaeon]RLI70435.1 MAG: hypothetical protein DRP02_07815 [Candidatus Gerdarchaeota archaeon]
MSDKEIEISEDALKGVKLKETHTKAQEAEMKLVFKCDDGTIIDWPVCCGELMELEGDKLVCHDKTCGSTKDIPTCSNGEKAKPFISKA